MESDEKRPHLSPQWRLSWVLDKWEKQGRSHPGEAGKSVPTSPTQLTLSRASDFTLQSSVPRISSARVLQNVFIKHQRFEAPLSKSLSLPAIETAGISDWNSSLEGWQEPTSKCVPICGIQRRLMGTKPNAKTKSGGWKISWDKRKEKRVDIHRNKRRKVITVPNGLKSDFLGFLWACWAHHYYCRWEQSALRRMPSWNSAAGGRREKP